MIEISVGLIVSAFFAGLLTFLAPCTLPMVPAFLGFISGVSTKELEDPATAEAARRKVLLNGIFFILGFSVIFILFGVLAGVVGQELAPYRIWFGRIGGLLVILFGLLMLGVFHMKFLQVGGSAMKLPSWMKAGNLSSSLLVGGAFAFGWTPCVGPILASILLVASTEGSAVAGAMLLTVFSLGLALPFILISFAISKASKRIAAFFAFLTKYRVVILALFGLILGVLVNIVLMAVGVFLGETIRELTTDLHMKLPWLMPLLVALGLGFWGYKHEKIDVLSTIGGLFLIALGILLATNSFAFLVQYGVSFFNAIGLEGFFDHL